MLLNFPRVFGPDDDRGGGARHRQEPPHLSHGGHDPPVDDAPDEQEAGGRPVRSGSQAGGEGRAVHMGGLQVQFPVCLPSDQSPAARILQN